MNLGDLEFKPEDFEEMNLRNDLSGGSGPSARLVAELANRLLRERLEKAPIARFPTLDDDWMIGRHEKHPAFEHQGIVLFKKCKVCTWTIIELQ